MALRGLRAPLSPDLFSEIALHVPNDTLLQLFYLSRASKRIARVVLYKNIAITKKGPLLVRTLASDRSLPPMIHSLQFLPEEWGQIRVDGLEWEQVLQQMSNLKFLTICDYIELTPAALQGITFRLKSLYSCDGLVAPWTLLLQNQMAVEELNIHGDIEGAVPVLPALRNVCAPPLTVANLLEHNPSIVEATFFRRSRVLGSMHPSVMDTLGRVNASILQTLRLRCPDFLYISHLPSLLPVLRHLVLDDDVTWQMTDRKYPRTLRSASQKLNIDVVPNLHTLRLVGARTHHNPSDIILAFRGQTLDLPHLHNIHFCTPTNCYNWSLLAHERGSIVDCEYFEGDFLQTIPEWDQEDGDAVDRLVQLV
ncbi:hypothetical protein C8J57DRAFT_1517386 [Mycena rebaudengoi]|nr:hypothetical protein C8J57DRAFT_1517386 [Mycena rebaudengoi]